MEESVELPFAVRVLPTSVRRWKHEKLKTKKVSCNSCFLILDLTPASFGYFSVPIRSQIPILITLTSGTQTMRNLVFGSRSRDISYHNESDVRPWCICLYCNIGMTGKMHVGYSRFSEVSLVSGVEDVPVTSTGNSCWRQAKLYSCVIWLILDA
jgi:hypothetical protein